MRTSPVILGASRKAVDGRWARWQAGGRETLMMRPRGKPVGVHQVPGEAEQRAVRRALVEHRPCDVAWAADRGRGGRWAS